MLFRSVYSCSLAQVIDAKIAKEKSRLEGKRRAKRGKKGKVAKTSRKHALTMHTVQGKKRRKGGKEDEGKGRKKRRKTTRRRKKRRTR